ncbi:DUF2235 domain-containing protein [Microvirga zambiensis]|uniref:DUF2235 domain-containing protein n=1 Tax=Microvirga zambiensis TaxID=1402137 RepID=UPI00191D575F|nr:DUF2235 domain-containing protein [Microvirga zambiensis]
MKRIILLSDGTGNSSAKLFKTNVWRMYQALDLCQPATGDVPQVAFYNDGVGTSSFKPLALLGGAFGWGLKRNVLDLYMFLCRTWEPGDEIYAFGFSRGAFTVRVLVGLVAKHGILRCSSDGELNAYARDMYRLYRQDFDQTGGLVRPLRKIRDAAVAAWRRYQGLRPLTSIPTAKNIEVAFVGVWDTVAAYGTPLAELTRGIDDWVWPLSMPDFSLCREVKVARHALALDDERDAFHPLLWDEIDAHRKSNPSKVPRLLQVWFAGMHADVGGGYPDDSLSYAPLHWMMSEAHSVGLRFRPDALKQVAPIQSASAPMHDSRRGLAGYYRYQPRKISARLNPPDPSTLIMQDPNRKTWPLLRSVLVHESVLERIRSGPHHYAPIVLPQRYSVVRWDGRIVRRPESLEEVSARVQGQAKIWNDVWRKRVNYFATVGVSLMLAFLPMLEHSPIIQADVVVTLHRWTTPFTQFISPLLQATTRFLPAFAQIWIDPFARNPGIFVSLVGVLVGLLMRGASLRQRIHDRMWMLWKPLHGQEAHVPKLGWGEKWIQTLRMNQYYQTVLQRLKWQVVPFVFGISMLAALIVLLASPFVVGSYRKAIRVAEAEGTICNVGTSDRMIDAGGKTPKADPQPEFSTTALCTDTGIDVTAGTPYRIRLTPIEPWSDDTIDTTPKGFGSERMTWPIGYLALPLRRSMSGEWLQTFGTIISDSQKPGPKAALDAPFPLEFLPAGADYVARFTAPASGRVRLWVNDAVVPWQGLLMPWRGLTRSYYDNNGGKAAIRIEKDE